MGVVLASALLPVEGHAQESPTPRSGGAQAVDRRPSLQVWAAASAGPALRLLQDRLDPSGHGTLRLNLDGTSRLARQLEQGAPADVFVSADRRWMSWAEARDLVRPSTVRVVARNQLAVVVPATVEPEAGEAEAFPALLRAGTDGARIGIAGSQVPAGRYAREALRAAGVLEEVEDRLVEGGNVRSVLEWVARGELPLGIVYRSDGAADDRVRIAALIPPELHEPVELLAAVVATSTRPDAAAAFVEALAGPGGQAAFRDAGFSPADGPGEAPGGAASSQGGAAAPAADPTPSRGGAAMDGAVDVGSAVRISVAIALAATLLGLGPAVALGWFLARRPFPGKTLVSAVLMSPLVIPPVVTGFLLLEFFGSGGPAGRLLEPLGVRVPFTFLAGVLAAAVVGFPLFVVTVRNAFEAVDPGLEEMSRTLGARPWRTFRRISLPLALPGIGAGAVLAFARALGEFGATVVLAGNLEGETRTIALAVYTLLEAPQGQREIWWLVGASVLLSFVALAGFEALSRRQRRLIRRDGHR